LTTRGQLISPRRVRHPVSSTCGDPTVIRHVWKIFCDLDRNAEARQSTPDRLTGQRIGGRSVAAPDQTMTHVESPSCDSTASSQQQPLPRLRPHGEPSPHISKRSSASPFCAHRPELAPTLRRTSCAEIRVSDLGKRLAPNTLPTTTEARLDGAAVAEVDADGLAVVAEVAGDRRDRPALLGQNDRLLGGPLRDHPGRCSPAEAMSTGSTPARPG